MEIGLYAFGFPYSPSASRRPGPVQFAEAPGPAIGITQHHPDLISLMGGFKD